MGLKSLIKLLFRSSTINAAFQLAAVVVCSAITLLFVTLTYSQIVLPRYTTQYVQKDVQQVVNLVITIVATVIAIILSHCRRLTNEAETRCELHNDKLTLPRLHVHFEAAGGSKTAMGAPAIHNNAVRMLVIVTLFGMVVFSFIYSVLAIVFVVDHVISTHGDQEPAYIPISVDIPEFWNGKLVDECTINIAAPGCAYDLAMTALTSQLVTYTPYTIAGVTFDPPNGTMGLPYYAMQHFSDQVAASKFEDERRQYCLPVLGPDPVSWGALTPSTGVEEPFNQSSGRTISNLVQYKVLQVYEAPGSAESSHPSESEPLDRIANAGMYKIIAPYPNNDPDFIKYRTNDEGSGTMLTKMSWEGNANMSILTASDSGRGLPGYASMLHELMYGTLPDYSDVAEISDYKFVAKCTLDFIQFRDNVHSSWRKVDFTLKNGVLRANVTDEGCPNPRYPTGSGFMDLQFYLEGSGSVLGSSDGYAKLFNLNKPKGSGTNIFQNMSRLDAVVNQIYHSVQTHWMQMSHEYAIQNQTVYDQPIMMTTYPHLYIVRINWTPTTYIGLVLSLLITMNAYILAARWLWATYRFGFNAQTWNLLRPIDLMAYTLAAYRDLIDDLNTVEHRQMVMRGETSLVLRSAPMNEGTESLRGLVKSSTMQSPISDTSTNSPFGNASEKVESAVSDVSSPVGTSGSQAESPRDDEEKVLSATVEQEKPSEERQDHDATTESGDTRLERAD